MKRKFFGTLYNTYSFFALYANIDGFDFSEPEVPLAERQEIDRWVISFLNTLVAKVEVDYADYEPTRAARKIQEFVESHLSNWYVRLCRRRFWKGEYTNDKIAAYQTLYTCLDTVAKLMAPIAPFYADWLFRNLNHATSKSSHESVHLAMYPSSEEAAIDSDLEQRMNYAQRICSLVLSLRQAEKLRVRQPLNKVLIPILDKKFEDQVKAVEDLILAEVNVKELEYLQDASGVIKKRIKPNFKTLGKKLGKDMKAAAAIISNLDDDQIAKIESLGPEDLYTLPGSSHALKYEDFEISAQEIPGWQIAQDGDITVALDISLTEELLAEGMARDLVNRIQNIRKDTDFEVTDRITVTIQDQADIQAAVSQFGDYIKTEVLADTLTVGDATGGTSVDLPGDVAVSILVQKV